MLSRIESYLKILLMCTTVIMGSKSNRRHCSRAEMTGTEKQSFLSLDPMTVNQCYCHEKHVIIIFFSFYCKNYFFPAIAADKKY